MRITLLVATDLRERMSKFLRFEQSDGGAEAVRDVLADDDFLNLLVFIEEVVRLHVLVRLGKAKIVRPRKTKAGEYLVDELLSRTHFVVESAQRESPALI